MNDNYTCSIDTNKISNSINLLNSIKNIIYSNDIFDYIQDIEKYINDTNFEHGNCIDNYKEDISSLYAKAEEIKQDLDMLIDSLYFSVENVKNTGTISTNSLKKLVSFYKDTSAGKALNKYLLNSTDSIGNVAMRKIMSIQDNNVSSINGYSNYQNQENITTIPPVQTEQTKVVEQQPYSTVPIGLGIAATGISAAAGTVYVDSMYEGNNHNSNNSKIKVDNYEDEESYEDNSEEEEETIKAEPYPKKVEEYIPPYHASRTPESNNIYYDFEEEK